MPIVQLASRNGRRLGRLSARVLRVVALYRRYGLGAVRQAAVRRWPMAAEQAEYRRWLLSHEPQAPELARQRWSARRFKYRPLVSILTPVFNPPPAMLAAALDSVLAQTYDCWELCLVDGGSHSRAIPELLERYSLRDPRIRVRYLSQNLGISRNSNVALEMAQGEFVGLLDHDDLLAPNALFEVVGALNARPSLDFIYTDRDVVSEDGKIRRRPLLKPGWSPDLLLSQNYVTHLCVLRTELVRDVGGFDPQTDGAQDWDLFLKVAERTSAVYHIPKILYHWRQHSGSVSSGIAAKPYARQAQRLAVENHLARRGLTAAVDFNEFGFNRLCWPSSCFGRCSIVLSGGTADHADRCARAVAEHTNLKSHEVLLVYSCPSMGTNRAYEDLGNRFGLRVLAVTGCSTQVEFRNYAASQATGDLLVFLDTRTVPTDRHWLPELAGWVRQHEIGLAVPQLYTAERRIAHCGLQVDTNGLAGIPFGGTQRAYYGISGSAQWYRNYLAVGGACLAVRRALFAELQGFDERLDDTQSTIDFCLRLHERGLRVVCTPTAALRDHGAGEAWCSRGNRPFTDSYRARLQRLARDGDPFFHPHLTLVGGEPRLISLPRLRVESPHLDAPSSIQRGTGTNTWRESIPRDSDMNQASHVKCC